MCKENNLPHSFCLFQNKEKDRNELYSTDKKKQGNNRAALWTSHLGEIVELSIHSPPPPLPQQLLYLSCTISLAINKSLHWLRWCQQSTPRQQSALSGSGDRAPRGDLCSGVEGWAEAAVNSHMALDGLVDMPSGFYACCANLSCPQQSPGWPPTKDLDYWAMREIAWLLQVDNTKTNLKAGKQCLK